MQKTEKIFVAGHRGMVGSAIVRRLEGLGYTNIVVRTRAELDLTDQSAVNAFFAEEKPEYVVLAAARVGGIKANMIAQADFLYENLQMQNNVIWSSHEHDVKKLVFLGSSCIYPAKAEQPIKEDSLLTGPLEPTNEGYAVAKIAGIKLCEKLYDQHNRVFISCMPTNLYGEGDTYDLELSHVIPALILRMHNAKVAGDAQVTVWGSGNVFREFLYVDDLARAVVSLLENYTAKEIVNIGTGEDMTIREIATHIKEVVGFEGELVFDTTKPDGVLRKRLDVTRMMATGWKPEIDIATGLKKAYDWFLANKTT